jgi:hypothetical protein
VSGHSAQTTGAEAYGKAVWFWHPWLVSSRRRKIDPTGFRQSFNPPAMEAKGIRLQGEHGISRQTTAQGMPGCSDCTCMLVCVLLRIIAHETAGAASTRHSLRPLISEGHDFANLGRKAPRECGGTLGRHRPPRRTIQYSRGSRDASRRNNSQQIAPANEWQLRLHLSALILIVPLLNRRL